MRNFRVVLLLSCLLALLCSVAARAEVKLANVFGDHMVLQRDVAVPVWGWAAPGQEVRVAFAGQAKQATADQLGRWMLRLDPLSASGEGRSLEVQSGNRLVLRDVLVGDVWICSGQSNMEWSVSASLNADKEIQSADIANIRLFNVPGHTTSQLPRQDAPGQWQRAAPQSVKGFSAVGYFFGRHLHQQTDIPIGLIGTNWGGTRIEPWTPPVGFRSVPELANIAAQVDRFDPGVPAGKETWQSYIDEVAAWAEDARASLAKGAPLRDPIAPPGFTNAGQPTAIYNAMVYPLAPYALRGAIWYQGESNGDEGVEYFHKMQALIQGWREVWNQENLPIHFYFVQLANWKQPTDDPAGGDGWARIREAQRRALTVPYTGMAVTTDIGEANDIHPRNKQDVGKRLALWALRDVYGQDVVVSGPLYRDSKVEENKIRIRFDHSGSGLMVGEKQGLEPTRESDAELKRFAIAGQDRKWHWANAKIDGDSVVVWSAEVERPVAVRYAYSMNPAGANLYNREGLPAAPFRTDDW